MKDLFKRYWWCLLLMITMPVIINFIVITPALFPSYTADGSNGWLGFFASYISSIIPFVILFFTIRDNHQENERNRNIQVRTIEYQIAKGNLVTVRQSIINYIQSLHLYELGFIPHYPKEYVNDSLLKLKKIGEDVVSTYEQMEFSLVDYNNEADIEYKAFLEKFNLEFSALIKDLAWVLDSYLPKNTNVSTSERIKSYREANRKEHFYYDEKKRVWSLLEQGKYDVKTNSSKLMDDLLDAFDFSSIRKETKKFITNEQKRIEDSLLNYR